MRDGYCTLFVRRLGDLTYCLIRLVNNTQAQARLALTLPRTTDIS